MQVLDCDIESPYCTVLIRLGTCTGCSGANIFCVSPYISCVEHSFISRVSEASHPCELFHGQLLTPGPDSNFGIVELVVAGKHRRLQRRHPAVKAEFQTSWHPGPYSRQSTVPQIQKQNFVYTPVLEGRAACICGADSTRHRPTAPDRRGATSHSS